MSAHLPAIIAREIAMLLGFSYLGVSSDETCSRFTVAVGLLVADNGSQSFRPPSVKACVFVDRLLPVVKDAIKTEFLHGQATWRSDFLMHDVLGVDPPVDWLTLVHLVGYDISEKGRVCTLIF